MSFDVLALPVQILDIAQIILRLLKVNVTVSLNALVTRCPIYYVKVHRPCRVSSRAKTHLNKHTGSCLNT